MRIDLADADPALEGKFTSRGEILGERDGGGPSGKPAARSGGGQADIQGMLSSLPSGVPVPPGSTPLDVITNAIVALGPDKQIELLQQMKVCAACVLQGYRSDLWFASQNFVTSSPDAARAVLVSHPQLAYACFQTMLMTNVVDPAVLQVSYTKFPRNMAP